MKRASEAEGVEHFDNIKAKFDAYGVGVRAGVITPQKDDEDSFREEARPPKMNSDAAKEWEEEKTRRPITITPKAGEETSFAQPQSTEDGEE